MTVAIALGAMPQVRTARFHCEWCKAEAAAPGKSLCGPCLVDFDHSEVEGVELVREDFEVEGVTWWRRK